MPKTRIPHPRGSGLAERHTTDGASTMRQKPRASQYHRLLHKKTMLNLGPVGPVFLDLDQRCAVAAASSSQIAASGFLPRWCLENLFSALPWPSSFDLDFERKAQEGSYCDDQPQHAETVKGRCQGDGSDDIGR